MAKKPIKFTFQDIVLNADADVIKQAYEARQQIDVLLAEREEAYRKIAELELQVEEVVGEEAVFPFPAPPMPVAGFSKLIPATRVKVKKEEPTIEQIKKPEPKEEPVEEIDVPAEEVVVEETETND